MVKHKSAHDRGGELLSEERVTWIEYHVVVFFGEHRRYRETDRRELGQVAYGCGIGQTCVPPQLTDLMRGLPGLADILRAVLP